MFLHPDLYLNLKYRQFFQQENFLRLNERRGVVGTLVEFPVKRQ